MRTLSELVQRVGVQIGAPVDCGSIDHAKTVGREDHGRSPAERDGTRQSSLPVRGMSLYFSLAPDGRRLVRSNPLGPTRDIWVHDLERGTATRLTTGNNDSSPIWTPD